jgi:uncharacterized small protein (DUF1192 family)
VKAIKNNHKVKVSAKTIGDVLNQAEHMERIARHWRSEVDRLEGEAVTMKASRDVARLAAALGGLCILALVVRMVLS